MKQSRPASPRPWLVRHFPDVCLAMALIVVLALSIDGEAPGRTDWVEAARRAVSGQVGAPQTPRGTAAGSRQPVAAIAARPG